MAWVVKPKFHYADFHRNFSAGKVVDTYHESRRHKRLQITKSWSFGESRQHKSRKSHTQTISTCRDVCGKVRDKFICVALMEFSPLKCTGKVSQRHDSCHGLLWFVSPWLWHKVGIMEFWLNYGPQFFVGHGILNRAAEFSLCHEILQKLKICWQLVRFLSWQHIFITEKI